MHREHRPGLLPNSTAGLQNSERAIIANVRDAGGTITAKNFKWKEGSDLAPLPRVAIEPEITAQGRTFNARLSYEQVSESWQRLDRPDVLAGIRNAVAALTH